MATVQDGARRVIREWLLKVADETGKSLSKIAAEAGLTVSTVTRAAYKPEHPHVLSTSSIAKISKLTGIAPPSDLLGALAGSPGRELAEHEAAPYVFAKQESEADAAVRSFIAGRSGIDAWVLRSRALDLAGYLPGDVVFVDLKAKPRAGDVVCAQIYDFDRGKAETIWRIYEPPYLVAASTDTTLRRPERDDAAAIKGVIIGLLRQRVAA